MMRVITVIVASLLLTGCAGCGITYGGLLDLETQCKPKLAEYGNIPGSLVKFCVCAVREGKSAAQCGKEAESP